MDIQTKIGQRLVFGFSGITPPEEWKQLVRKYKAGNVILFRENMGTAEETRAMCREIQKTVLEETGYPAFITIDEEGGLVSRMPESGLTCPGNMAVAATGKPENARKCAEITARQLCSLGVNFNLAPVLDVNNNSKNPVIGVRSWGDRAENVAAFARESIAGYRAGGVLCCGKHFPGHGDTDTDSHLGLPCVNKRRDELEKVELLPFREAIRAGIPAIMSSHILFPALEPEKLPATLSRKVMTGVLRDEMGFDGLILSDGMLMDAIRKWYGTPEGVVAAMKAGIDLVMVCRDPDMQTASADALMAAWERGELDEAEMDRSVDRILKYKRQYAFTEPELISEETFADDQKTVNAISRAAVTLVQGEVFHPDEKTFFCGCNDYRASLVGNGVLSTASFPMALRGVFGGEAMTITADPDEQEIAQAVQAASACQNAVVITLNAHLKRGQAALAHALREAGKQVMMIAMRNPYDLQDLPADMTGLAAFDFTDTAKQAVTEVLQGGPCTGIMPVRLS